MYTLVQSTKNVAKMSSWFNQLPSVAQDLCIVTKRVAATQTARAQMTNGRPLVHPRRCPYPMVVSLAWQLRLQRGTGLGLIFSSSTSLISTESTGERRYRNIQLNTMKQCSIALPQMACEWCVNDSWWQVMIRWAITDDAPNDIWCHTM